MARFMQEAIAAAASPMCELLDDACCLCICMCASACMQVDELWLVNLHMHAPTVAESSDVHTPVQIYTCTCIHLFMHTRFATVRGVCDGSCNS